MAWGALVQTLARVGPRLAQAADVASAAANVASTGARMMKARPGAEPLRGGYGPLGGSRERIGRYGSEYGRAAFETATGRWISALRRSTNALNNWSLEVIGSMDRLARVSPVISLAAASLRFGRLRREMLFARDVGPSAARVYRLRDEFEEALRPIQTQIQQLENNIVAGLLRFGTWGLERYQRWFRSLMDDMVPGWRAGREEEEPPASLLDTALEEARNAYDRRERIRRRM